MSVVFSSSELTGPSGGAQLVSPPPLAGYSIGAGDAYRARDDGRLLSLWIETSAECNLCCVYCGRRGAARGPDSSLLEDLVRQAGAMGCSSVCFSAKSGDPLLYPGIRGLVELVDSFGMVPVVFTNGTLITAETAGFLLRHHASVMVKLDSFIAGCQDHLAGRQGAFEEIRRGFCRLLETGFGLASGTARLGATFTLTRANAQESADFWRFCRAYRVFPEVRPCRDGEEYALLPNEVAHVAAQLREIDRREYGYDWNVNSPLPGSGCLRFLCSMYVTLAGDVRPCPDTDLETHPAFLKSGVYPLNVGRKSLRELYYSGPMYYCRNIDSFLEGKSRECSAAEQCIGCRAYAYESGLSEGMGPLQALASRCRGCVKQGQDKP